MSKPDEGGLIRWLNADENPELDSGADDAHLDTFLRTEVLYSPSFGQPRSREVRMPKRFGAHEELGFTSDPITGVTVIGVNLRPESLKIP